MGIIGRSLNTLTGRSDVTHREREIAPGDGTHMRGRSLLQSRALRLNFLWSDVVPECLTQAIQQASRWSHCLPASRLVLVPDLLPDDPREFPCGDALSSLTECVEVATRIPAWPQQASKRDRGGTNAA